MWGCVDEKEEKKKKKKKKKKVACEGRTTSVARQVKSFDCFEIDSCLQMGEGRVDWDPDLRKLLFVQSHHTFR